MIIANYSNTIFRDKRCFAVVTSTKYIDLGKCEISMVLIFSPAELLS